MQQQFTEERVMDFAANYTEEWFGTDGKKKVVGVADKRTRVCRFCGGRPGDPDVTFKKRAHAVPRALGNDLFFCADECDGCNERLHAVEDNLTVYLDARRGLNGIRNKEIVGQNYRIEKDTHHLYISPSAILEESDDRSHVLLLGKTEISHYGIYRALAKVALDLIKPEEVKHFQKTIDWVNGYTRPAVLPDVYFFYNRESLEQPVMRILTRKDDVDGTVGPACIVILTIMDLTFIYLLPFSDKDDEKCPAPDAVKNLLPDIFPILDASALLPAPPGFIDMQDKTPKFGHIEEWIAKGEYTLVSESEFDTVKEKSPNKVDFPPLDFTNIKFVEWSQCVSYSPKANADILREMKYENCDFKLNPYNHIEKFTNPLKCKVALRIESLRDSDTAITLRLKTTVKLKRIRDVIAPVDEDGYYELTGEFYPMLISRLCREVQSQIYIKSPDLHLDKVGSHLLGMQNIRH